MRRDRNRRGSAKAPRDNATQPRSRAAARAPQSPEFAVIDVLRKAARPLRLDEVAAEFGPAGAAQAEQDLAQLVKRGEVMLKGQTATLQFDEAGNIAYICGLHPGMKGTIEVAAK